MRTVTIMLILSLSLLTGCNISTTRTNGDAPLERTTLRIAVGNAIDTAPLRLAVEDGSFTRAGLHVDLVEEQEPLDGIDGLAAGQVDIAFATDVALFGAASRGTALQLQGEAYTSAPFTMTLMTLPNSEYTDLSTKKNPRIAVDQDNDLGALAARAMFTTAGADPTKIRFVVRAYQDMPAALRDGSADAALMTEPFITKAQQDLGARVLADSSRGATMAFPVSAYAASGLFAQSNEHTLAAFRRVLAEAQQRADDPTVVRAALPRIAGIDETTAALVSLGQYPTSLSGVRLQRVADLMHNTGMLAARLDVPSMLPREVS